MKTELDKLITAAEGDISGWTFERWSAFYKAASTMQFDTVPMIETMPEPEKAATLGELDMLINFGKDLQAGDVDPQYVPVLQGFIAALTMSREKFGPVGLPGIDAFRGNPFGRGNSVLLPR